MGKLNVQAREVHSKCSEWVVRLVSREYTAVSRKVVLQTTRTLRNNVESYYG